jgi:hypothetical protein
MYWNMFSVDVDRLGKSVNPFEIHGQLATNALRHTRINQRFLD